MDTAFATRWAGMSCVLPPLLFLLVVINGTPYVPLQDYNEWTYQGYIAAQILLGHLDAPLAAHYAFASYPVPNSAVQAILTALNCVVPATLASRLVASAYSVFAIMLAWRMSLRIAPSRNVSVFFVLLVCVYFNTPFWNGYMNYQMGMLLFTVWLLLDPSTRRKPQWVLLFTMLAFFTHAVIWAAILLMIGLDVLRRRRIAAALPALASIGLFAWYAAQRHTPVLPDPLAHAGTVKFVVYKLYTLAKLGPYHHFTYDDGVVSSFESAGYYVGCAVNAAFAVGIVVLLGASLRLAKGPRLTDERITACVLFALFMLLPAVISDLVNPGERVLYPALLLMLCSSGAGAQHETRERAAALVPRVMRWMAISGVVCVLCATGLLANGARLLYDASEETVAGTPPLRLFQTRPAAYADVLAMLDDTLPLRALSFETSFLINNDDAFTGKPRALNNGSAD
ncbi:hypothetical protein [Paraburkholderia bannensis]|uniref:hypothetical protein n=1 Tax=Paraburkholderia bannensis TaxID=765414 RepID=UPI002AB645AD|nr:hypothetical protein [Paraburkholderia bannensis]